jgi:hypothetical protein
MGAAACQWAGKASQSGRSDYRRAAFSWLGRRGFVC